MQENETKNKAIDRQLETRLVTWGQASDDAADRRVEAISTLAVT